MRRRWLFSLIGAFLVSTPACAGTDFGLEAASFSQLPGWQEDNQQEALAAFRLSCTKLSDNSAGSYGSGLLKGEAYHWQRTCEEAAMIMKDDRLGARSFFERMFDPFKATFNGSPEGKFTGYYEPLVRGSWKKGGAYTEPVYARPEDLANGAVYPLTRRDIDNGALSGKGLELLWLDSPVDAFFLHVQGSGRVLMDTGETVALRFAAKNNQPYTAIGKVLIERGALTSETVSAPAIREWLGSHREEAREVMQHNQSFVFFTVEKAAEAGPRGAQNVTLTPERSLAVDASFIPLGMPVYLSTSLPDTEQVRAQPYQRLLIAQDKGTAITGAIRGDVFFGFGDRAAGLAGKMNQSGQYWVLVPKTLSSQLKNQK